MSEGQTNASQLALNELAQQRYERRHAAQVSWHFSRDYVTDENAFDHALERIMSAPTDYPDIDEVVIQNRAPAPMTNVWFVVNNPERYPDTNPDREPAIWKLPDLRPCDVVTLTMRAYAKSQAKCIIEDHGVAEHRYLYFVDPGGLCWRTGHEGLQQCKPGEVEGMITSSANPVRFGVDPKRIKHEPASDCGESF